MNWNSNLTWLNLRLKSEQMTNNMLNNCTVNGKLIFKHLSKFTQPFQAKFIWIVEKLFIEIEILSKSLIEIVWHRKIQLVYNVETMAKVHNIP